MFSSINITRQESKMSRFISVCALDFFWSSGRTAFCVPAFLTPTPFSASPTSSKTNGHCFLPPTVFTISKKKIKTKVPSLHVSIQLSRKDTSKLMLKRDVTNLLSYAWMINFWDKLLNGDHLELNLHPLSNWRQCFALAGSLQPSAKSTFQWTWKTTQHAKKPLKNLTFAIT